MKNEKKSKILIGFLALLLVMAVGYALFSENITINGTATAKGDFNVTPTGTTDDLKKLDSAMYEAYSKQVQEQIENQNSQQNIPWASVCAQIGIQATGDYDKDYAAFNNAIQLLSQSAIDGQAMTYFAGLKTEASQAFGLSNKPSTQDAPISYQAYQAQFLY